MSIDVICPSCDMSHRVKDESAGKKLKCKGCQKILAIPTQAEAAEGDPWDNLDENEGGEKLPPVVRQAPAGKRKAGKGSKSRSRDGIPIPIMVSIGINGIQIVEMLIIATIRMIAGDFRSLGGSVRIVVDCYLINGLRQRKSRVRWHAIVLDAIGLGSAVFCGGPSLYMSTQLGVGGAAQKSADSGTLKLLIAIAALQLILWATDLVMLLTRSAKEYCNEQ